MNQIENISNSDMGKLSFFSKVYKTYGLQKYLTFPLKQASRSYITKLRISAHTLCIETGRYNKPPIPRQNRLCKFCPNSIEDETHFLLNCPKYEPQRNKYDIFKIPNFTTEAIALKTIMNPDDHNMAKQLSFFIFEAFEVRYKSLNEITQDT